MADAVGATPATIGSGPDTIIVNVSEDAFQGDTNFTLSVDGTLIGGVQTATASHALGQQQSILVAGDFGPGPHTLTVDFLNDAYGGTPDLDRNLWLDEAQSGGVTYAAGIPFFYAGPQLVGIDIPAAAGPVTIGNGSDSIVLGISEDAYQGDARFTVSVDGMQVGGVQTATAAHGKGESQDFTLLGNFGGGAHVVGVTFLNDAYGGTPVTDRNLWVDSIAYAGLTTATASPLFSEGTGSFSVAPAPTVITGPVEGHAVLNGTPGDDRIVARGSANAINGNGGNDVIAGSEGGGDAITVGAMLDDLTALREIVTVAGNGNSVGGGDEATTLSGTTSGTVATLGNGRNTVSLDGSGNAVQIGTGMNTLAMTGGNATILITGPRVAVANFSDAIVLSGENNTVGVKVSEGKYPAPGNIAITGGTGYGSFNLGWGSGTVDTDGPGNVVSFGYGTFDISPGDGNDTVIASGFPGTPIGTIHLAGTGNVVRGFGAQLTVTGGTGSGSFDFDDSTSNVTAASSLDTGGEGNVVTQRGGNLTIRPGSGGDTVSIFGGTSSVIFQGSGNMLFIHPGQPNGPSEGPASVASLDQSTGLQVFLDPGFGAFDVSGFDPTGVIHLLGGAGGFTSPEQVAAAVVYDHSGFDTLLVGDSSIVFSGNAPLTAAQFAIG